MNINEVRLAGRLTRDIELRYSPNGAAIGKLSLATTRTWKDQAGEKKEESTFVDCTTFGKQAEVMAAHLKKGETVYLAGRLRLDSWEDKSSGQKRNKLEVVVERFEFVGGKQEGRDNGAPPAGGTSPEPEAAPTEKPPF